MIQYAGEFMDKDTLFIKYVIESLSANVYVDPVCQIRLRLGAVPKMSHYGFGHPGEWIGFIEDHEIRTMAGTVMIYDPNSLNMLSEMLEESVSFLKNWYQKHPKERLMASHVIEHFGDRGIQQYIALLDRTFW
jgi:hypothetical protein